jgi:pimeloyl-ACP methyl ester carboxylesterase
VENNKLSRAFSCIHYQESALDIHYRVCGNEANDPIIVLHPSPLSSGFMVPLLSVFGQTHYAIAWDAPGYGDSSKLPNPKQSLVPYIDCLALFMEAQGIDRAIIYGNATGAQIAVEFSKKYPEKTVKLLLENVTLFDEDETTLFLKNYFPDLSPKENGQHLEDTWKIVNNLFKFFPWYEQTETTALNVPEPPVEVLQATLIDYLKAGVTYSDAYIAAIKNERADKISAVNVHTDIVVWQDSIVYKYCCRLNELVLPTNMTIHKVSSGMDKRIAKLKALISNK